MSSQSRCKGGLVWCKPFSGLPAEWSRSRTHMQCPEKESAPAPFKARLNSRSIDTEIVLKLQSSFLNSTKLSNRVHFRRQNSPNKNAFAFQFAVSDVSLLEFFLPSFLPIQLASQSLHLIGLQANILFPTLTAQSRAHLGSQQ